MLHFKKPLIALCLCLILVPPACAWNAVGHSLVAKLAYQRLKPEEREQIVVILRQHPHAEAYLLADRPANIPAGEWMFMQAANWSDWIRPPRNFMGSQAQHPRHKYHRGPWHYVNYPYRSGQTDLTLSEHLPQEVNILTQLAAAAKYAKPSAPADPDPADDATDATKNRAVRLCWLIHLVGDIHQPCHVTAWVDPVRLPGGDEGGNKTSLRVDIGAEPTKLHTFWDALLGTDADPDTIDDLAASLLADPKLTPDQLSEAANADFKAWAQESYTLCVDAGYLNGELPIVLWDDYKSGAATIGDVPILPIGTEKKARTIARRQIVLAAHRLADQLRGALEAGN
jgi:hypothetical protein